MPSGLHCSRSKGVCLWRLPDPASPLPHTRTCRLARVAPWLRSGAIWFDEDLVQGIGQAPAALVGLFQGEAVGKRLVQVAPESLG